MIDEATQQLAQDCAQFMFKHDTASKTLGIAIERVSLGCVMATMTVRTDMLNGHQTCHGGFIFSLADSAFAFACNSQNQAAVAAGCTIDFLRPALINDQLKAEATQIYQGKRSGIYHVEVTNQHAQIVALFKGNSARINRPVLPE